MINIQNLFFFLSISFLTTSIAFAKAGDLLQITEMAAIQPEELDKILYRVCPGVVSKIERTPVKYYALVYETTDVQGGVTRASAALLIPPSKQTSYSTVSYQHGTLVRRGDAPSLAGAWTEGRVVGGCYASQGYAVVQADYLGFGASAGYHPYHHAQTEGSAAADAIQASKQAAKTLGIQLNEKLFLAGYSQGGHATMALHKYLQENLTSELPVTASAPMAGAYHVSQSVRTLLQHPDVPTTLQAAYLFYSYFKIYSSYPSLEAIIVPQYAAQLASVFPGEYQLPELIKLFPPRPEQLLQPEFLKDFLSNDDNPVYKALQLNDVYNWKPAAPVMFIHGDKDLQVPVENSILAHETMQKLGAQTQLVILPGKDHLNASEAFSKSIIWFNSF